jgi:hypothetical protein
VHIENAGGAPYKSTFLDQGTPTGARTDYFRYSFFDSTTDWAGDGAKGQMAVRVYFDRGQNDSYRTEYFDPKTQENSPLMITNRYNDPNFPVTNRHARLGVELMRPNEPVDGSVEVEDSVFISSMQACFSMEKSATWQMADQYLNAGCSTGSNLQYSWQTTAGGAFTSFSSNSTFDFGGHATTGSQTVTLRIKNTSTQQTTDEWKTISVQTGQVTIDGPTYVTDKQTKTYTSSVFASHWHERTGGSQTWSSGSTPATWSYQRIWAAGNYTVDLRADSSTSTVLRRGKATVTVCATNCMIDPAMAAYSLDGEDWGFFGGGPILSHGTSMRPDVSRLYELTGAHHPGSPFASPAWFYQTESRSIQLPGSTLAWRGEGHDGELVRSFEFSVTPADPSAPYVFGFSWDPDIGAPADDRSGYDPALKLVYAFDSGGATGILLLANGENDLHGVEQYGAMQRPPVHTTDVYRTQRDGGTRLSSAASDVQFVLASEPAVGQKAWKVVFLRAATVAELRRHAAEILNL